MLTDPSFYAVAVPAVILYGLSKGGFSGVSLLAMPMMALAMPPFLAAAVILPVLMVQDAFSVWTFRKSFDRKMLSMMLPGAILGISAATFAAAHITADQVRVAVGCLAILFSLNAWLGPRLVAGFARPHHWLPATFFATLSGFSSFVIHAGGAPYNIYAVRRGLPRELFVGTSTMFFAVINLLKLPGYLALGQLTTESMTLSAALFPLAVAANAAGIWLVRRLSTETFYKVIYILTFLAGIKLLSDGIFRLV
jgi:uncharacterized membrane protein YfcA